MKHRWAFVFSFLFACGSTVTQDPPHDPTDVPDASTDAPADAPPGVDAGPTVIGQPCSTDTDCGGGEYRCQIGVPGGYCTIWCATDAECPAGTLCAPVP
ncbi:MAG TPA: hypothetical protein PKA58_03405, partial [Polyangium sp.]|nr:hypothetical protein [Polyangium sp.]